MTIQNQSQIGGDHLMYVVPFHMFLKLNLIACGSLWKALTFHGAYLKLKEIN